MSNNTFLIVVAAIILALVGVLMVQKLEDCAEQGGKACPRTRFYSPEPASPAQPLRPDR
jgi:hypothetical protein